MSHRRNMLFGWTLAVLAIALFVRLGFWQSQRAVDKQSMLDGAAQVLTVRDPVSFEQAFDPSRAGEYDWYVTHGGFAARPPLLLDNQMRGGRAGVRVYRIFYPYEGDGELLVDLGWLPLAGDRALPDVQPAVGNVALRGLLAPPPSPGLALGASMTRHDWPWLMTRIDLDTIEEAVGNPGLPLAPRVLRLDPALPLGHDRDLELLANTLPPAKHQGYAVQWFALAIAVLVTALILTFRRSNRPRDAPP